MVTSGTPHGKGALPHDAYVGCFHPYVGISLSLSTHGAFFTLHLYEQDD